MIFNLQLLLFCKIPLLKRTNTVITWFFKKLVKDIIIPLFPLFFIFCFFNEFWNKFLICCQPVIPYIYSTANLIDWIIFHINFMFLNFIYFRIDKFRDINIFILKQSNTIVRVLKRCCLLINSYYFHYLIRLKIQFS